MHLCKQVNEIFTHWGLKNTFGTEKTVYKIICCTVFSDSKMPSFLRSVSWSLFPSALVREKYFFHQLLERKKNGDLENFSRFIRKKRTWQCFYTNKTLEFRSVQKAVWNGNWNSFEENPILLCFKGVIVTLFGLKLINNEVLSLLVVWWEIKQSSFQSAWLFMKVHRLNFFNHSLFCFPVICLVNIEAALMSSTPLTSLLNWRGFSFAHLLSSLVLCKNF